jgi:hypothetical protein
MLTENLLVEKASFGKNLKIEGIEVLANYWKGLLAKRDQLISSTFLDIKEEKLFFDTEFNSIIPDVVMALEEHAARLLGAKLNTPYGLFVVEMVEIYADGIWDETGDFIKNLFLCKKSLAEKKLLQGPRLYMYGGRVDIKLFEEFLPFSFLIRNLRKPDGTLLNTKKSIGAAYPKDGYINIFGDKNFFGSHDQTKLMLDGTGTINMEISLTAHVPHTQKRICNGKPNGVGGRYKEREWNFSIRD